MAVEDKKIGLSASTDNGAKGKRAEATFNAREREVLHPLLVDVWEHTETKAVE